MSADCPHPLPTAPISDAVSPLRSTIVISTRKSNLAVVQAEHVQSLLQQCFRQQQESLCPATTSGTVATSLSSSSSSIFSATPVVTLALLSTTGDNQLLQPLSSFINKGIFTKELDLHLLQGESDCSVHCMKDMPTTLPDGIIIGAVLVRGSVEDAVVLPAHIAAAIGSSNSSSNPLLSLPVGARIGTSALRRQALMHHVDFRHKNFIVTDVRGNINTRLAKLDAIVYDSNSSSSTTAAAPVSLTYDALILAATGLERIAHSHRVSHKLNAAAYEHAVGQGALVVLCRANDKHMYALLRQQQHGLHHQLTHVQCVAERQLLKTLQGGCKVPISVYTWFTDDNNNIQTPTTTAADCSNSSSYKQLHIKGGVHSVDGLRSVTGGLSTALLSSSNSSSSINNDVVDSEESVANEEAARVLGDALAKLLLSRGADVILDEIHNFNNNLAAIADEEKAARREDSSNSSSSSCSNGHERSSLSKQKK